MKIHRQLRDIGIVAATLFSVACSSSHDAQSDSQTVSQQTDAITPVNAYSSAPEKEESSQYTLIYRYCLQGIPGPFQSVMDGITMMDEEIDKEKMTPAMKNIYESVQLKVQTVQGIRDYCSTQQDYDTALLIASYTYGDLVNLYAIQQEMQKK